MKKLFWLNFLVLFFFGCQSNFFVSLKKPFIAPPQLINTVKNKSFWITIGCLGTLTITVLIIYKKPIVLWWSKNTIKKELTYLNQLNLDSMQTLLDTIPNEEIEKSLKKPTKKNIKNFEQIKETFQAIEEPSKQSMADFIAKEKQNQSHLTIFGIPKCFTYDDVYKALVVDKKKISKQKLIVEYLNGIICLKNKNKQQYIRNNGFIVYVLKTIVNNLKSQAHQLQDPKLFLPILTDGIIHRFSLIQQYNKTHGFPWIDI